MKDLFLQKYFEVSHRRLPSRDVVWPVVTSYLEEKFIPKGSTVLDLGAGYCVFINNLKYAKEKHALDISPITKEHAAGDVICHIQDAIELASLPQNHFDVIFASHFFEHLDRDEITQCLQDLKSILKPGGLLIALQPNFRYAFRNYFDDFTHKQIFTDTSFGDLLRAFDYEVVTLMPKFLPLTLKSKLPKHPLLVKLYLRTPFKPFAGAMLAVARKPSQNVQ